jgi:hypothetical protein
VEQLIFLNDGKAPTGDREGNASDAQTSLFEISGVKNDWVKFTLDPSQEYQPFPEKTSPVPYRHWKGILWGFRVVKNPE